MEASDLVLELGVWWPWVSRVGCSGVGAVKCIRPVESVKVREGQDTRKT